MPQSTYKIQSGTADWNVIEDVQLLTTDIDVMIYIQNIPLLNFSISKESYNCKAKRKQSDMLMSCL